MNINKDDYLGGQGIDCERVTFIRDRLISKNHRFQAYWTPSISKRTRSLPKLLDPCPTKKRSRKPKATLAQSNVQPHGSPTNLTEANIETDKVDTARSQDSDCLEEKEFLFAFPSPCGSDSQLQRRQEQLTSPFTPLLHNQEESLVACNLIELGSIMQDYDTDVESPLLDIL